MENRNEVTLSGRIVRLSQVGLHTEGILEVERNSGAIDRIPFTTKQKVSIHADWVRMFGSVQTKNLKGSDGKNHKKTFVCADRIAIIEHSENKNEVEFTCTLVRKDCLRRTPKGKVVMDIVAAINDGNGSQYPSCIVWGSVAENVDCLDIGSELLVQGRFQSREYIKTTEEFEEVRVAYEISVKTVEVL